MPCRGHHGAGPPPPAPRDGLEEVTAQQHLQPGRDWRYYSPVKGARAPTEMTISRNETGKIQDKTADFCSVRKQGTAFPKRWRYVKRLQEPT